MLKVWLNFIHTYMYFILYYEIFHFGQELQLFPEVTPIEVSGPNK